MSARGALDAREVGRRRGDARQPMMASINDGWIAFRQPGTERVPATLGLDAFFARVARG